MSCSLPMPMAIVTFQSLLVGNQAMEATNGASDLDYLPVFRIP
jgi:hypothetical protein